MKNLILPMIAISFISVAESEVRLSPLEAFLADTASQLIYLEKDCGKPMDSEKFQELAKVKAISEGYFSVEGVDWDKVKLSANIQYGQLKSESPLSERCGEFREEIRGNYRFLQDSAESISLNLE